VKKFEEISLQPAGTESLALDELLYSWKSVWAYTQENGFGKLNQEWVSLLTRELNRTSARVTVNFYDMQTKQMHIEVAGTVGFGGKRYIHAKTALGIQPPMVSVILQRVGLNRLWSRI